MKIHGAPVNAMLQIARCLCEALAHGACAICSITSQTGNMQAQHNMQSTVTILKRQGNMCFILG